MGRSNDLLKEIKHKNVTLFHGLLKASHSRGRFSSRIEGATTIQQ